MTSQEAPLPVLLGVAGGLLLALAFFTRWERFLSGGMGKALAKRRRLTDFKLREVVRGSRDQVVLLGRFQGLPGDALVTMKHAGAPRPLRDAKTALRSLKECRLQPRKVNGNYGYYDAQVAMLGRAKVDVVWPVDRETVQRQRPQLWRVVRETPEMYAAGMRRVAESETETKRQQWVYNILDGVAEADDVLHADEDFMLVGSPKWDKTETSELLLLAIPQDRSLRSVRDLRGEHLGLLTRLRDATLATVLTEYGVEARDVLLYFHLPPQFWHLHVHVCHVMRQHDRGVERARLLDDVLQNLERDGEYYANATIVYTCKEGSAVHRAAEPAKLAEAAEAAEAAELTEPAA